VRLLPDAPEPPFLALVVSGWAPFARLLRGQVLAVRETEYVEAARAGGAGPFRIMRKHVLPNSMAPVMVVATLSIGGNITGEAALSFLGVGVQPPTPEWGALLSEGMTYLERAPHVLLDRVSEFLMLATVAAFRGGDPTEMLSLARLSCDVPEEIDDAPVFEAIRGLLDSYEAASDTDEGVRRRGAFLILAVTVARTPEVPLPDLESLRRP